MKAATNVGDIKSLLENVTSKDVCDTLNANAEQEDAIFQKLERIQVLSDMQCHLDASDSPTSLPNRLHYSQLLHEQILELRRLVSDYFG